MPRMTLDLFDINSRQQIASVEFVLTEVTEYTVGKALKGLFDYTDVAAVGSIERQIFNSRDWPNLKAGRDATFPLAVARRQSTRQVDGKTLDRLNAVLTEHNMTLDQLNSVLTEHDKIQACLISVRRALEEAEELVSPVSRNPQDYRTAIESLNRRWHECKKKNEQIVRDIRMALESAGKGADDSGEFAAAIRALHEKLQEVQGQLKQCQRECEMRKMDLENYKQQLRTLEVIRNEARRLEEELEQMRERVRDLESAGQQREDTVPQEGSAQPSKLRGRL